jgi:hypothetical protein
LRDRPVEFHNLLGAIGDWHFPLCLRSLSASAFCLHARLPLGGLGEDFKRGSSNEPKRGSRRSWRSHRVSSLPHHHAQPFLGTSCEHSVASCCCRQVGKSRNSPWGPRGRRCILLRRALGGRRSLPSFSLTPHSIDPPARPSPLPTPSVGILSLRAGSGEFACFNDRCNFFAASCPRAPSPRDGKSHETAMKLFDLLWRGGGACFL